MNNKKDKDLYKGGDAVLFSSIVLACSALGALVLITVQIIINQFN
tara:strand:- start:22541 stop:22675 length:135 start_codon:yes stop_codon:yes gene_type:complete